MARNEQRPRIEPHSCPDEARGARTEPRAFAEFAVRYDAPARYGFVQRRQNAHLIGSEIRALRLHVERVRGQPIDGPAQPRAHELRCLCRCGAQRGRMRFPGKGVAAAVAQFVDQPRTVGGVLPPREQQRNPVGFSARVEAAHCAFVNFAVAYGQNLNAHCAYFMGCCE